MGVFKVEVDTSIIYLNWHAGLQKYRKYNARIAASTVHGRGPLSNMTVFQTYEDSK